MRPALENPRIQPRRLAPVKWILGVLSTLLLINIFAQQQTINDLRVELKKANSSNAAPLPSPSPSSSVTSTTSATPTTPQTKRPVPQINWAGDVSTCNKYDKTHDWWALTHAYLSDPVKYTGDKVWFRYSQSYVNTFAFCFDKTFVTKVNEIALTVN
jgi:hypothetical protein